MASNGNWIKLYRSMLEWEWYDDIVVTRVFLHLLLIVNRSPYRKRGVEIPAGSIDRTQAQIAEELNLSRDQVKRALKCLRSTDEITITRHSKYSVISINKWDEYQTVNPSHTQHKPHHKPNTCPTDAQLYKNNKNIQERKEEKDEFSPDGVTWIDGVPYYSDEFLRELHKND